MSPRAPATAWVETAFTGNGKGRREISSFCVGTLWLVTKAEDKLQEWGEGSERKERQSLGASEDRLNPSTGSWGLNWSSAARAEITVAVSTATNLIAFEVARILPRSYYLRLLSGYLLAYVRQIGSLWLDPGRLIPQRHIWHSLTVLAVGLSSKSERPNLHFTPQRWSFQPSFKSCG